MPFRIAHLSDLHLTARDHAPRSEPGLFAKLSGMNAAFRRIVRHESIRAADLVLVTGDVTDRGELDAWQVFWDAIDGAGLRERTLVVPGNHDVCCLGARLPSRRRGYRRRDLEKAIAGLELGGQPVEFPWVRRVRAEVAIFGLNSNNLGNFGALDNALGDLGYNQLARLARLLRRHSAVPVKIVALHHSPQITRRKRLFRHGATPVQKLSALLHHVPRDQRRALRLLCVSHGVRLVVHGHLHSGHDRRVDGVRYVGVPATTEPCALDGAAPAYVYVHYVIRGRGGRIEREWKRIV